jgi:CDP-4-dehydro-6-deoxyglucose reductase
LAFIGDILMTKETKAQIVEVNPLTDTILQVVVAPETYIDYQAGQYLQLLYADTSAYYSIANAPMGTHRYELHIRHSRDKDTDKRLLDEIKQQGFVTLRAPFGICDFAHLDPIKPILFIAAGTGFAPVKAMIEQLLLSGDSRCFELIWSARTQSDLYLEEKVKQWQTHVKQFQHAYLLTSENKQAMVAKVLARHAKKLNQWQIVISGPFDLVYRTRDQLIAHGVARSHLYSDAFQFEGG